MLVKCIGNRLRDLSLSDDRRAELRTWFPSEHVALTPHTIYVVYAVSIRGRNPWYYVADDTFSGYPLGYSAEFFELVDDRLSKFWRFRYAPSTVTSDANDTESVLVAPPQWVQDSTFYERLVDSDQAAAADFERVKALIELEFPHPSVHLTATDSGDDWLMCPKCNDAWETHSRDGLVRCPSCSSLLLNPRFGALVGE